MNKLYDLLFVIENAFNNPSEDHTDGLYIKITSVFIFAAFRIACDSFGTILWTMHNWRIRTIGHEAIQTEHKATVNVCYLSALGKTSLTMKLMALYFTVTFYYEFI